MSDIQFAPKMGITITFGSYSTRITNVYCLDHLSPVSKGVMNWQIGDLRNLKSPFIVEFFAATFLKALYMYQV